MEPDLKAQYPAVAWGDFAGFRDVLIHQYDKIRIDLVWRFAQEDLPALKQAVAALLNDRDDLASSGSIMRDV